jgi:predicted O-methyltransferase YrrM
MRNDTTEQLLNHVFETAVPNNPASIIDAIDAFSRTAPGMIHLGAERGAIFDRIVGASGAKRVLELGTNYGYSALRMACNLGAEATIQTIELDEHLAFAARGLIDYAGLQDRIQVICGRADQVMRRFDEKFDLVFVDHLPENYLCDLQLLESLNLVGEGSLVVTDNVVLFEYQLGRYLHHLRHGGGYASTTKRTSSGSDGLEISTRQNIAA